MGATRRPIPDDERKPCKRCAVLRAHLVLSSNGYSRCTVCGCEWHSGDSEVHDADCIAAPRPSERARASSSGQNSRGAASKRSR